MERKAGESGESLRIARRGGGQSATKRAGEIAATGFGSLARRRLLAEGLSGDLVDGWLRRGLLHPRYPGVYAWGREDLTTEGELAAALLYAGKGAALTDLTMLWWLELLGRRPRLIYVDAPGRARSRQDIHIRHPRRVERRFHRGLPVVPLPTALLVAAPRLSFNALRLVLARAEFHHHLSLPELEIALGRGRSGSAPLRAAMDRHLPQLARCANRTERRFVLLCESGGVEIPEPNERIGRYRPDMLFREAGLIVEIDGPDAHSTPAQLAADTRRQAELEARGYRFLRFHPEDVRLRGAWVLAAVRAELAAGRITRSG